MSLGCVIKIFFSLNQFFFFNEGLLCEGYHTGYITEMKIDTVLQCGRSRFDSLGWEDSLEKGMATHGNILAWRIPWIEEPGGLQSMGSARNQTQLRD